MCLHKIPEYQDVMAEDVMDLKPHNKIVNLPSYKVHNALWPECIVDRAFKWCYPRLDPTKTEGVISENVPFQSGPQ